MSARVVVTASPKETRAFARSLGEQLDNPLTIWLSGPLGAGKTCFAQGVAAGLGVPADEPVVSPSYTLMNLYQGRLPLYHFDYYRLSHPDELDDLGGDEFIENGGVSLVEWADRFDTCAGYAGGERAGVHIELKIVAASCREIVCRACGVDAEALLSRLFAAWKVGAGEG